MSIKCSTKFEKINKENHFVGEKKLLYFQIKVEMSNSENNMHPSILYAAIPIMYISEKK